MKYRLSAEYRVYVSRVIEMDEEEANEIQDLIDQDEHVIGDFLDVRNSHHIQDVDIDDVIIEVVGNHD